MRSTLILFLLAVASGAAQVSSTVEVHLFLGDAQTPDGQYSLVVRWYDAPVGGSPFALEMLNVEILSGSCSVVLGNTSPLPLIMLQRGTAFLGVEVGGTPERLPRVAIVPQTFARVAARAEIANALAPEVTGIVTSINEIAGNVKVVGESGIRVVRDGTILRINRTPIIIERGAIEGDGFTFQFRVLPSTSLTSDVDVTFRVNAGTTTISAGISIDAMTNTIVFVTSAPLLSSEKLEWEIRR